MKKVRLSHRITWRVIGIISFFNVLIIGVILVFVFSVSLMNSDMRGQYVVDGIEGKIESLLWAVHVGAANSRDEVERNIDNPEQVFDALEREITANQFMGCFAAFEPDYFQDQGRWFEAYLYHIDSTRLERRQIGSQSHDYFNGPWYRKGLGQDRQGLGYLTTPYFDNSVDSSMYCSYVLPIVDRQWHQEHRLGSIEFGKVANMTVFDCDFLHDDIEKVAQANIVATIIDGEEVYKA